MLQFKRITPDNVQEIIPYLDRSPLYCSDLSAGFLVMWRKGLRPEFAVKNGTAIIKREIAGSPFFSYPLGSDPVSMINELARYASERDYPLKFFGLSKELAESLKEFSFVRSVAVHYDPMWSDYVYDAASIMSFKGRKYNGQRNHLNKYARLYGNPVIVPIDRPLIPLIREMMDEYLEEHADEGVMEEEENKRALELIDNLEAYALLGAALTYGGKVVGFTVAELRKDMLVVHVEKALRKYEGAYPALFHGAVNLFAGIKPGIRIINREDDSGDPGLRTSKRQYHPIRMIDKYSAFINSPASGYAHGVIKLNGLYLTGLKEKDKENYLKLSEDLELNKWWGYDYTRDPTVTLPLTLDTFYDMAARDSASGETINFAVRLSEDGEMIGETVLWNFTFTGKAEVGIRLMREYQGLGLSTAAFAGLSDYAESVLGLKVNAKCYKENVPSRKMIEASGFRLKNEDGTFYYYDRT